MQNHGAATTRSLQEALDSASWNMNHWTACLPFVTRDTSNPTGTEPESQCGNILEYLKPMYKGFKIYFSAKYNHVDHNSSFNGSSEKGWRELLRDLGVAGMGGGFYPVSNGGHLLKRIIICKGSRMYSGTKQLQHSPSKQQYRTETLHADRNNSRGKTGKVMPRKTRTTRSLDSDSQCGFRFTVRVDENGFYLVGGTGCAHHSHHPKVNDSDHAVPTRFINVGEKDILVSVGCANANDGVGRNVHFSRCGYAIPRSQVRYMSGFQRNPNNAGSGQRGRDSGESSVDSLLKSLKQKGYDHCILYHHVKKDASNLTEDDTGVPAVVAGDGIVCPREEVMVNETFGLDVPPRSVNIVQIPECEADVMHEFGSKHRCSLLVNDNQDLMMGCAWTTPPEKRLFKMFSEVLHIDCTADTNHEDRPFLTITGRNSLGNMFTVLRAYLPNERAWVFRWLFQTVMPTLLGKDGMKRVKVIVTDGDSQETSQLDIAISLHFGDVCRVRCGWHIVDRGWLRVCPGPRSVARHKEKAFKAITNQIKAWLYSWMQPACETEEEYKISKALLGGFLRHPTCVDLFNEVNADRIRTFIRENVEPLEAFFCFYRRRTLRHFDTYTNSGHEGTNNGLKAAAAPVLPQHSLDRSAAIINQNATIKASSNSILSATAVRSQPLWSKLPTSHQLTHKGEGLVTHQWKLRDGYLSQRVDESSWCVVAKRTRYYTENAESPQLIPRFSRVRKVFITDDRILLCSCKHFERIGIPCRHQMHVLSAISKDYAGITHHDVAVTWWKGFVKYAFNDVPGPAPSLYQKLLYADTRGPSVPLEMELMPVNPVILDESLVCKPTKEMCLNYSVAAINRALSNSTFLGESTLGHAHDGGEHDDWYMDEGVPCSTQQETNTYGEEDAIVSGCLVQTVPLVGTGGHMMTPYSVLVPLAKELSSILEGNCTIEELKGYQDMLSNMIVAKKRELNKEGNRPVLTGQMVSSSVHSNKRKKSHGTKHMM
jgi:MULE transposase domain